MKTILQKTSALLLSVILICALLSMRTEAGFQIPGTCRVQADSGTVYTVKTLDHGYDHNTYLSLRDMAAALAGTDKAFSVEITGNTVSLNTGEAYFSVDAENEPWEDDENPDLSLRRNEIKINGQEVSYYTMIMKMPSGHYDCFMMTVDLAMILDLNFTVSDTGTLCLYTQEPFRVSPAELEAAGYFYGVNSVLTGDATTGEIYYRYQSDTAWPIASTSKLMTCLLAMEALQTGQISLSETVTISEAVQALADSADGVIPLKAGEQITVQELLYGALLPSSNECALCLAETIAGSEEAFVQRMNQKAQELGLSQAYFYNSHGLPSYTQDPVPAKRQNRMSAEDMFRLISSLLNVYPQITDIISLERVTLESLDLEVRNTNPLLRNLSGVTGLKTGTTNKAGACLVTSLTADDGTMEHDLAVIVLGAEDSIERGRVSGILARYALQAFHEGAENEGGAVDGQNSGNLPTNAEAAVTWILRNAGKRMEH